MDLNELPSDANPTYCTQAVADGGGGAVHDIEAAPDQQSVAAIGGGGATHVGNLGAVANDLTEDVPTNADSSQIVEVEEIWSTPPVPYTGQTFATKQEAREFYNLYAKRIGFSIRTGTSPL
ncbi:hypothetical protein C2845_PM17G06130 [Panicum miliaceum]|uniref:Protein FAR1-RELATED SEQUENCE n=1 Tax=Panicum miliaceum TaxID=4540 RepID=A0A3L6Q231_PANMI|nr:hypothetical protein C2845_PM17G06130 [Panicum miliaceum]